jgi:glycosyltransferase involved in cell wall biosynthesis
LKSLLVICHGYPPYYGGAEHAAHYLAREAARSGDWRVTALTSDIGGRLPADDTLDGVRVLRVRAVKREWTRHSSRELAAFLLAAIRAAPKVVEAVRPDFVLAHFTIPAGEIARRIAGRFGIPYTVVLHGSDVPGYQPARFGIAYFLLRPAVRRVWRSANHVVAVTEDLGRLAAKTWPEGAVRVIRNGVDTDRFRPHSRTGGKEAGRPLRLVTVAQLIPRKGLQCLVESLRGLCDRPDREWNAVIYGSGPERSALESAVAGAGLSDQVRIEGLIAHDDLPGVLAGADVFVLPSLQEGLPLAVLEAMAAGLPVVATRVGGVPSVIDDGRNGLLVEPADPVQLRAALAKLMEDGGLRVRLGAQARAAAERFSWARAWEEHAALMEGGGAP